MEVKDLNDIGVNKMEVKDFLGKVIRLGHVIVYPGRKRSDLWMNRGIVNGIDFDTGFLDVQIESGRYVTLKHPKRVVVVDNYRPFLS